MLLACTQIAKRYNYAAHKKIIGFIKIINCWSITGGGGQQTGWSEAEFRLSPQGIYPQVNDF